MHKDELIHQIDKKESFRILKLSDKGLLQEYNDWFGLGETEMDRVSMSNDLLFDFMKYREDDSEEELKEILARY